MIIIQVQNFDLNSQQNCVDFLSSKWLNVKTYTIMDQLCRIK